MEKEADKMIGAEYKIFKEHDKRYLEWLKKQREIYCGRNPQLTRYLD